MPAVNPEIFAPIDKLDGDPEVADPDVADNVNQVCVLFAVQPMAPPPVFEIVTGCVDGLDAPAVVEKVSGPPETDKTGAEDRFNVMLMVAGDPATPEDATVTVSV